VSLVISQTQFAVRAGLTAQFGAAGGVAPYTFACSTYQAGVSGAGGTIDPSTGIYTAPSSVRPDPHNYYDTITVTDSSMPAVTGTATIFVGYSWQMVLDVLMRGLNLDSGHCYLWDQKIDMPTDAGLIIVIGIPRAKAVASNIFPSGAVADGAKGPGWDEVTTYSQVNSTLDLHAYSRSAQATYRLPEIFATLQGPYSRTQQSANGFYLSKIPHNAVDMSEIDGSAIPYHFVISCEMIWTHSKTLAPPFYSTVPQPVVSYIQS